jgi:hypothetical protein
MNQHCCYCEERVTDLNSSGDGIEDDGQVQCTRKLEAVSKLLANRRTIRLVKLLNLLKESRRLRDKCALDQKRLNVFELMLLGECCDIREQFSLGDTDKRIADPARVSI